MNNLCTLCGETLVEGKCPTNHGIKKMCLNCADCDNNDGGELVCTNETHKKDAIEKAKAALNGFSLKNIEIDPLPLKNPSKTCKLWAMDEDVVNNELKNLLN